MLPVVPLRPSLFIIQSLALIGLAMSCAPNKDSSVGGDGDAASGGTQGGDGDGDTSTTGGTTSTGGTVNDGTPKVHVYLLLGQSNMWGVSPPEDEDKVINPKVEVMALTSCGGQTIDSWYPAAPPLHGCIGNGNPAGNPGVGPGDSFAKAISEAYPDDTILLVPTAIPGESIDTFLPGEPAYASIVSRATKAKERGPIRGMLFHQGESDNGSDTWLTRVNTMVTALRADLSIPDVPFIAAELPYTGCCGNLHNPIINNLPDSVMNSYVVSSAGLDIMDDGLHFDTPANRELGRRYAEVMLTLLAAQ
jgi:hypothetical protein